MGRRWRDADREGAAEGVLARMRRRVGKTAPAAAVLGAILALMVIATLSFN